jgi:TolA-binding protein
MKLGPSVYASLIMAIFACFALWRGEKEFSHDQQLQKRVHQISRRLMEQKIKTELAVARLVDFKQEVGRYVKLDKKGLLPDPVRELASVIPHQQLENRDLKSESSRIFQLGKNAFDNGQYEVAIQKFLETVSKYPDSVLQLEASYFLIRSFYLTGNKQEALVWVEKLLKNYPESHWTAKSMVVMAHIYVDQNRKNDALDVYQTVLNTFHDPSLQEEVKRQLVDMGLL